MKNITELREEMIKVFEDLRDEKIATGDAKELSNACGKVIASVKVQLEYANMRKEIPDIEFLK